MGFLSGITPVRVKVIGVRTAHETKVLATYNSSIYCVLIEFDDGHRELKELETKEIGKYLKYIDMDY